eukprot:scaffold4387_cov400-Prasinococcus_capsulatus_cf.AAC.4
MRPYKSSHLWSLPAPCYPERSGLLRRRQPDRLRALADDRRRPIGRPLRAARGTGRRTLRGWYIWLSKGTTPPGKVSSDWPLVVLHGAGAFVRSFHRHGFVQRAMTAQTARAAAPLQTADGAATARSASRTSLRRAAQCVGRHSKLLRFAGAQRSTHASRSARLVVRADRAEEARKRKEEFSKKMNDMIKAEQRWQRNLKEGLVLSVSAEDGEEMVRAALVLVKGAGPSSVQVVSGEYKLLDVRQEDEYESVHVSPCVHVPLFTGAHFHVGQMARL